MHIRNIWWNQRFPICNKTCPPMYMVLGKLGSGQSGNCPGPNCPQLKEKNSCRLIWILLGMKVIKNTFPTVICWEIRGNARLVKRPISSGRLVSKCSPLLLSHPQVFEPLHFITYQRPPATSGDQQHRKRSNLHVLCFKIDLGTNCKGGNPKPLMWYISNKWNMTLLQVNIVITIRVMLKMSDLQKHRKSFELFWTAKQVPKFCKRNCEERQMLSKIWLLLTRNITSWHYWNFNGLIL